MYENESQVEVYDPITDSVYSVPDQTKHTKEIKFSVCHKIVEDYEHNIWLCTNNGLYTYSLFQNSYRKISDGLPLSFYSAIAKITDDRIWFGSFDNGVYEYSFKTKKVAFVDLNKPSKSESRNYVSQIIKQKNDSLIWIAHQQGNLSLYNLKTNKWKFFKDSLFQNQDISLSESANGNLYVVGQSGAVEVYNAKEKKFNFLFDVNELHGLKKKVEIISTLVFNNKFIFIGTSESGLMKIDLVTKKYELFNVNSNKTNSLRSNVITLLKQYNENLLFGGTYNGIFCYDNRNGKIENLNYNNYANLGYIGGMTFDKNGDILVTSTNGMYQINWERRSIVDLGKKSNLDNQDLIDVCYCKSNQKVYLSSENALYELTQNKAEYHPNFKPILYSIKNFNQIIHISGKNKITIDKNHRSFQVNFGVSSFEHKDDFEFYYKLDDNEYQLADGREVAFNNLSGGEYHFKLKAVSKEDVKFKAETSLIIDEEKKFHETIWFYLTVGIGLAMLLYGFYRIRIDKLMSIEKVRLRLSHDLHDDMGFTLSTMNILSTMAAQKLNTDEATTKNYLERISDGSQQMMDSMDDIVWSINPANDNMSKVIYRMREFAISILELLEIELFFNIDPNVEKLKMDMAKRHDFYLVFKESINNAAKYSCCTKITVGINIKLKQLILIIQDNGKGFDTGKHSSGNGLINMQKRALAMQATYKLESTINYGTTVKLFLNTDKI